MARQQRPNYGVYYLDLSTASGEAGARSLDLKMLGTRIALVGAYTGGTITQLAQGGTILTGGSPTNAQVNLQLGQSLGDPIPLTPGCEANVPARFEFARITWAAQSGVIAVVVQSDDADGNGVHMVAPPTVTLGQVFVSQGGNVAKVTSNGTLQAGAMAGADYIASLGASVFNVVSAGVGSTTILAPASNVNGLWLRTAVVSNGGAAASGVSVLARTTAPTHWYDTGAVLATISANGGQVSELAYPIFVPAGIGLYQYTDGASGITTGSYDLL